MASAERRAERRVERVDRAVALGGGHDAGACISPGLGDVHLDGGLGGDVTGRRVGCEVVGDHAERLDLEPRLRPAPGPAHEQLERRVGDLEVVAVVLHALQRVDELVELRAVERQPELGGLELERALARELRDHEPGAVADGIGGDVLVGVGALRDRTRVQARLVRERRRADIGRLRVERHVHELGDVVRDRREPLEPVGGDRLDPHLQREVRDDRGEVAVADALAVAVDGALHLDRAAPHTGERVRHAGAGVVVQVHRDADTAGSASPPK